MRELLKSIPLAVPVVRKTRRALSYVTFVRNYFRFKGLSKCEPERFRIRWRDRFACLVYDGGHDSDHHYIYHIAWAARVLARTKPKRHVDFSSSLYFCAAVSAHVPIEFFDLRPTAIKMSQFNSGTTDLARIPFPDCTLTSISCMHVVEHIGLGRYGDALDPSGDLKAMAELARVLAPGGQLLFVVPIASEARIVFNAHRVYRYEQIRKAFSRLELAEFSLITDNPADGIVEHASRELADQQKYGCGCFLFKRPLGHAQI